LRYPPASKYTTKFLSSYIGEIEKKNKEAYEPLYTTYLSLLSQMDSNNNTFYRTYRILKTVGRSLPFDTVTIKMCEEWNEVGLIPWPGTFSLLFSFFVSL
jgi:hypothetical protein